MDTISMLITGWIIFFFCAVALLKYVYRKFGKRSSAKTATETTTTAATAESVKTVTKEKSGDVKKSGSNKLINKKETDNESSGAGTKADQVIKSNGPSRSESNAVRRRRLEREQFSQSFDLSDKNQGPCNGPDAVVVDFVNRCYEWLFASPTAEFKEWNDVRENLIDSINKTLREDEKTNPNVSSVVDLSFKEGMKLSNCFAECEHENTVKVTSDCEASMTGVISRYSADSGTTRHDFYVDRLCGRLNILLDSEEESAIIKFDGWPEICVAIASSKKNQLDPKVSEALAEKLTGAIRNAVIELELKKFPHVPKAPKLSPKKKIQSDTKSYLVAKVIRGMDIGLHKGCEEPYCAIELDEPAQKFQTDAQTGHNPYWGENFVFNILPGGGEILFEVFDRVGTKFMGCNIVSVEEIGEEKNRFLPLKSRRMEMSEQITGSIEVQFTFLDEKEFLQKSREIIEKVSPNGNLIKTTKTVFTKPPSAQSEIFTEKVLQDLNAIPNANKSTLIIHSVQRESPSLPPRNVVKVQKNPDGHYIELAQVKEESSPTEDQDQQKDKGEAETVLEGQYGEERGRRRTRRGDIFTSIRRRFSKTRSRSANQDGLEETSLDREQAASRDRDFRAVSVDRDSLVGRHLGGILGPQSARSSASELSALSGHSTSTFIHENSTLVIECIENRIRKYYLVPPHLAETGKWKKRGKKLHIFNDHTFVAKHIQSGTACEICNGRFTFSLGKQGYQCRDCKMKCHKECHVRASTFCSNTTVYDIELGMPLESIKDGTAKCVPQTNTFSEVCSSIFSGKKSNASTTNIANGKNCLGMKGTVENSSASLTNNSASVSKVSRTTSRKKSSIFRRVTRLGKISEENLEGNNSSKGSTVERNSYHPDPSFSSQQDREVMEEKSIEEIFQQNETLVITEASSNGSAGKINADDASPAAMSRNSRVSSSGSSVGEDKKEVAEKDEQVVDNPDEAVETIEPHMPRSPGLEDFAIVR